MWRFSLRTVPVISRKLSYVLSSPSPYLLQCHQVPDNDVLCIFAKGNITPAIYQRPLLCVLSVMSRLAREARQDSGVRPERRLSHDAESPGEK